jgi:two-component system LytT family sensor kinase
MNLVLISLFLFLQSTAFAQNKNELNSYKARYFHFHGMATDTRMMVRQDLIKNVIDTALYSVFQTYEAKPNLPGIIIKDHVPRSSLLLGIRINSSASIYSSAKVANFSKRYASYLITDSSTVDIVAMGINKDNWQNFKYRIIEDDKVERISWSSINGLAQDFGAIKPYGAIGNFYFPGKKVVIEVAHKDDFSIRDGFVLDWRKIHPPSVNQIIINEAFNANYFSLRAMDINKGYATVFAQNGFQPLDWSMPKDSVASFRIMFDPHETRPYAIFLIRQFSNATDTLPLIHYLSEDYFDVKQEHFSRVGNYNLVIQQAGPLGNFPEEEILQLKFTIQAPQGLKGQQYNLRQIFLYTGSVLILAGLGFAWYRRQTQAKFRKAEEQKFLLSTQLQHIRTQLDPHFMFNSLNAIRNLMQKGDTEASYRYLSTFATLTRDVLHTSEKELYSLSEEVQMLEAYLTMEQLRFGFQYQIKHDLSVHTDLIEVPPLLIQPLIENAVRHGVSGRGDSGLITVLIYERGEDLWVELEDNGSGFKNFDATETKGYGLSLTRKRFELLNALYSANQFVLTLDSSSKGTLVQIQMQHWLAKKLER